MPGLAGGSLDLLFRARCTSLEGSTDREPHVDHAMHILRDDWRPWSRFPGLLPDDDLCQWNDSWQSSQTCD